MENSIFEERRKAFKDFPLLPLFYMIPDEIAVKRKLDSFPRDPYVAVTSEKWREVYKSKHFQVTLLDTWGWMMWQTLGIRGGIDSYSKNDPFVRVTFDVHMWAYLLAEQGLNTDFMALQPPGEELRFVSMEQAVHNCTQIAKRFWNHPDLKMKEVFEIVQEHRAHADYSSRGSHIKFDFYRKYYHTRAKTKVIPIIGEDEEIIDAPYIPNEFAEVEIRIWLDGFFKRLQEKDRQIVKLLEAGYTQVEIAKVLKYANHSGVCKRIKHIQKEFLKYKQEEREWESKYN